MTEQAKTNGNPYAYFGHGNALSYASGPFALPLTKEQIEEDKLAEVIRREIEESYGGDKARAEAASIERRKHSVSWLDIEDAATTLPEFEEDGRDLVVRRLGYLPHDSVLLEFEPVLRTLLSQQRAGLLSDVAFTAQADEQIRALRNQDLQRGDWVANTVLDADDYERYEMEMPAYKQRARERVVRFLGYEPDLLYSLEAEIRLRRLMACDEFYLDKTVTVIDAKVLTIILYRELYIEDGPDEADAMPLLGVKSAVLPPLQSIP